MATAYSIEELGAKIAETFKPERIVLFGSHATGTAGDDSDIDLLVIMPFKGSGLRKAVEIIDRIKPRRSVDLVVRTPEDIRHRLALNDFFLRDVLATGRILYESPHR